MTRRPYAAETEVSSEKSRAEIEATLRRYGADAFGYSIDGIRATIAFRMDRRHVRFSLLFPDPASDDFHFYYRGSVKYRREPHIAREKWEQACRQKWRALALVVKAKLEAVDAGITTVEDEFLAHTVLADGSTVGDQIRPQLAEQLLRGGARRLSLTGPSE